MENADDITVLICTLSITPRRHLALTFDVASVPVDFDVGEDMYTRIIRSIARTFQVVELGNRVEELVSDMRE